MMRLDKFLCDTGIGSRSVVKQLLKKGLVTVNGAVETSPDKKIEEHSDIIIFDHKKLSYSKFHYYMLHKPAGVITSTQDKKEKTIMHLLENIPTRNLFPVGRLDKDTEGLLLITDDGDLAHKLLSPKKHVDKTYLVELEFPITKDAVESLEAGVDIGDKELTMPAKVKIIDENRIEIIIQEGRYHQVKRMMRAVDNKVLYLKRISMGPLLLPPDLEKGCFRPLLETEIQLLMKEK